MKKCEFCEKDFENVNFVKNEILKMWILSKMKIQNYEFCQNWKFKNLNFVKNEIWKMWIFGILQCSKYEFLYKSGFLSQCA